MTIEKHFFKQLAIEYILLVILGTIGEIFKNPYAYIVFIGIGIGILMQLITAVQIKSKILKDKTTQ
jgi:hypothetical protein